MTRIRGLRWWIIGLIFLATLINFIDRLTVSILGPVIMEQLHLTNAQFGSITAWFLVAYTASQGLSGKLYDRIGSKRGFTISVLVWSIAACLHAFGGEIVSRDLVKRGDFRSIGAAGRQSLEAVRRARRDYAPAS